MCASPELGGVLNEYDYRIVVGVDGSEGGRRALRWALREAVARGATIQAIHAWRWDGVDLPPHATTHPDQERQEAERTLAREVEEIREPAGVTIATEVAEGRAADVLTAAARDATFSCWAAMGTAGSGTPSSVR